MAGKTTTNFYSSSIAVSAGGALPEGGPRSQISITAMFITTIASKDRWIQFFEGPTAPQPGDVPVFRLRQPPKGEDLILQFQEPMVLIGGGWWATSINALVYDPVVNENDVIMQVQYF